MSQGGSVTNSLSAPHTHKNVNFFCLTVTSVGSPAPSFTLRTVSMNLLLSADLIVILLNMILWQHACPRIPFAARSGAAELTEKANGKV